MSEVFISGKFNVRAYINQVNLSKAKGQPSEGRN